MPTDDVPAAERSAPRFVRSQGNAFVIEGVEPGMYQLEAFCFEQDSEAWTFGQADAEVKASGETRVAVTLVRK